MLLEPLDPKVWLAHLVHVALVVLLVKTEGMEAVDQLDLLDHQDQLDLLDLLARLDYLEHPVLTVYREKTDLMEFLVGLEKMVRTVFQVDLAH